MDSVELCGNTYTVPQGYEIEVDDVTTVTIGKKDIHPPLIYKVTKKTNIGGELVDTMLFTDIYIFEYGGYSYLIFRYVKENGEVITKIGKHLCCQGKIISLETILSHINDT